MIGTIVVGLIAGLLARLLKPGDDSMGLIMTVLLGIGGAFAMTALGRQLGWYGPGDTTGFIGAFFGAFAILVIIGLVRGRAARS